MAQHFLSINKGQLQNPGNVLSATSAPTADVYVQILSTNTPTRMDVRLALEAIMQYITSNYIPAGTTSSSPPVL